MTERRTDRTTLQQRLARWETELTAMTNAGSRWGECRRFAGRSAGIRIQRREWLITHIADATVKLRNISTP